jgi:hypothetical protein
MIMPENPGDDYSMKKEINKVTYVLLSGTFHTRME